MSLRHSVRVRGVAGTLHFALLRCFNFNGASTEMISRMLDLKRFDREHGVDTAGLIELDELEIESRNKAYGIRYGGVAPWKFKETLEGITVDYREYTFIDIGSGKGAALLHASEYPFAKIIGVEFAPALHEIALRNLATFRPRTPQIAKIVPVCQDAATYEFPEGPLILFFNFPFGVPIWKAVTENLARAPRGVGKTYVIFLNYGHLPEVADYVAGVSFLKLIYGGVNTRIYECAP